MKRLKLSLIFCFLSLPFLFAQEPKPQEEENELNVTAERMEILLETPEGRVIELTDNVRFEDNAMTLTADRMKIFLAEAPKKDEKKDKKDDKDNASMSLKRMEAYGNVLLRKNCDAEESATGATAVYDTEKDIVTLSGDCVIKQQGHVMKGKEVIFDHTRQKITVKNADIRIHLKTQGNKGLGDLLAPGKKDEAAKKDEPPKDLSGRSNAPTATESTATKTVGKKPDIPNVKTAEDKTDFQKQLDELNKQNSINAEPKIEEQKKETKKEETKKEAPKPVKSGWSFF